MGLFTKGKRLDSKRLKRAKFPLPELGDDEFVIVRALSQREVMEHVVKPEEQRTAIADKRSRGEELTETEAAAAAERKDFAILALCLVNEEGDPIFDSAADVEESFDVSAETIAGIVRKIVSLSGMDKKDRSKN